MVVKSIENAVGRRKSCSSESVGAEEEIIDEDKLSDTENDNMETLKAEIVHASTIEGGKE